MLTGKCLKLSDFGLAVLLPPGRLLADKCGTPAFMAPELQQLPSPSPGYTFPVDLWAAGVTFYVIIAGGRHPFASKGQHQLDLPRLLQGKLDFSVGPPPDLAEQIGGLLGFGTERSPDPRFPEAARELCRRMVKVNPAQRITAHQALQHPWILRTHGVKTRGIPQADKENVPRLVAPPAGKITSSNVNATNKATIPLMPAAPDNSSGTLQDLSAESESPRSWPSFIKEIPDATKTQQVELDDQSLAKEAHQHIMEQDRLIQSLQAEIVSLRNESVIDRTAALEADVAHQESVIASLREELALLQPNLKGKLEEAEQTSKKLDNQHQIQGDSSTRQDADVDEATQELRYRPEEEQSHLLQQADVVADEELRRAFEEQSRLLQQKDEEIAERDRRLAEQSTKLEWLESELRAIRESQPESSNCFSCRGQKKSQKRSTRSAC
jgi:serine/threonine protein kinase